MKTQDDEEEIGVIHLSDLGKPECMEVVGDTLVITTATGVVAVDLLQALAKFKGEEGV